MIKALLKQYQSRPLRMIEIHRDSMHNLHQPAEILSQYNLKFILFIDDRPLRIMKLSTRA